jgi:hypothetical protein
MNSYLHPKFFILSKVAVFALLSFAQGSGGAFFYAELHLPGTAHGFSGASRFVSAIATLMAYLGRIHARPLGRLIIGKWFFAATAVLLLATLIADIWVSIRMAKKLVRNFIPLS